MATARSTNFVSRLARSVLLCTAKIYGPTPAFPQITGLSGGRPQGAQPTTDMPSSSNQSSKDHQTPSTESIVCGVKHLEQCLKDIGQDQAGIWTSPLRLAAKDAIWLLPFAGATGVALHYDAQARQELGINQSRIQSLPSVRPMRLLEVLRGFTSSAWELTMSTLPKPGVWERKQSSMLPSW